MRDDYFAWYFFDNCWIRHSIYQSTGTREAFYLYEEIVRMNSLLFLSRSEQSHDILMQHTLLLNWNRRLPAKWILPFNWFALRLVWVPQCMHMLVSFISIISSCRMQKEGIIYFSIFRSCLIAWFMVFHRIHNGCGRPQLHFIKRHIQNNQRK